MGEHFRYAVSVAAVEDHRRRLPWTVFCEGRDAERGRRATNVQHKKVAADGDDSAPAPLTITGSKLDSHDGEAWGPHTVHWSLLEIGGPIHH